MIGDMKFFQRDTSSSEVKFTITGNGVVHAQSSEILKMVRAQSQVRGVASLKVIAQRASEVDK